MQDMEKEKPDLNRAIKQHDWERVFGLIKDGADVNFKDAPGMTPLVCMFERDISEALRVPTSPRPVPLELSCTVPRALLVEQNARHGLRHRFSRTHVYNRPRY